ncbi:hypothetical protein HYALB_00001233 [Hymenoscyphus albidus]|uniref:non-specific serine/threonine protein kinase n=1 Tax=Hymenoscyphus albidus TaxID=595503 RepID=A0A9N9Q3V8_9HELO|nr:hypothetical protein HYALB_00001233 [Hymenoscyphus albidus]
MISQLILVLRRRYTPFSFKAKFYLSPQRAMSTSPDPHSAPKKLLNDRNFEEGEIRYHKGGFHPVRLGEIYNSKYKVLRKLGYGRYSTVWLVKNQDPLTHNTVLANHNNRAQKLWAMKVLSAECYGAGTDVFELEIMQHLTEKNPEHEGYPYISTLHDSFRHEGPNGSHVCLIMKVMGETLSTFANWFDNRQIPHPLVHLYSWQLLAALDYAHSCGVIHTDIQPRNIMMKIPDESVIERYLETSEPVSNPDTQESAAGSNVVATQSLRDVYFPENFNLMNVHVALGDWGVASWVDRHLTEHIQPVLLRSPEVLLEAPWGPAVDIWNLGALVPEMIYAQQTFSGESPEGKYSTHQHLEEIATLLEPFPKSLLDKGNREIVKPVFDEDGNISEKRLTRSVGLEQRFKDMPDNERNKFIEFVRALMTVDPEKRESAKVLMDHPWFKYDYSIGG